jgi:hypothetical protein
VIIDATPLDAMQFTAQYELLRSQVVGAAGDAPQRDLGAHPCGVGLALLLREGMPGWLNAIDAVIRASLVQRTMDTPPAPEHLAPPWLSGVQRQDITSLLTSLVLSTRRVERSSPREGYGSCQ